MKTEIFLQIVIDQIRRAAEHEYNEPCQQHFLLEPFQMFPAFQISRNHDKAEQNLNKCQNMEKDQEVIQMNLQHCMTEQNGDYKSDVNKGKDQKGFFTSSRVNQCKKQHRPYRNQIKRDKLHHGIIGCVTGYDLHIIVKTEHPYADIQ